MRNAILLSSLMFTATACAPVFVPSSPDARKQISTSARMGAGEFYYPNYRMPTKTYVEVGYFNYEGGGNVESRLQNYLRRQGLDGAIIIDNLIQTYDGYQQERLKFMGFVYLENVDQHKIIDNVSIERRLGSEVLATAKIHFDWRRQITGFEGDSVLVYEAQRVQPWYFLAQKTGKWEHRYRYHANLPDRRLRNSKYNLWYNKSLRGYYRFNDYITKNYRRIYLDEEQVPVMLKAVKAGEVIDTVHSVVLEDRVVEQRWNRSATGETIRYKYHYKGVEDVPQEWIVHPEDLHN